MKVNGKDFFIVLIISLVISGIMSVESIGPKLVEVVSPLESNGAIPVNIQDQHTLAFDLFFIQPLGPFTFLSNDSVVGVNTINVSNTSLFVDGVHIGIVSQTTGEFYFGDQVGAAVGNTITLDTPVDFNFSVGDVVIVTTHDMNVDGSVDTEIFQIGPFAADIEIDITRIMGYLQDGVAMDDSGFGGIGALTYGVVFRLNNGMMNNYWNAKTNGELSLITYDFTYTSRAPAGSFGARFRNSYAGQEKHGVTIRLGAGDTLEVLIQDDLTGLEAFTMMAQGHLVTD